MRLVHFQAPVREISGLEPFGLGDFASQRFPVLRFVRTRVPSPATRTWRRATGVQSVVNLHNLPCPWIDQNGAVVDHHIAVFEAGNFVKLNRVR